MYHWWPVAAADASWMILAALACVGSFVAVLMIAYGLIQAAVLSALRRHDKERKQAEEETRSARRY